MEPVEPVNLTALLLPLHTLKSVVLFNAASPATAFGLTVIVTTLDVADGHGLLDNTALYAVLAVNAPVVNVAVVPVPVATVRLEARHDCAR